MNFTVDSTARCWTSVTMTSSWLVLEGLVIDGPKPSIPPVSVPVPPPLSPLPEETPATKKKLPSISMPVAAVYDA